MLSLRKSPLKINMSENEEAPQSSLHYRMGELDKRMTRVEVKLGSKLSWPWFIGTMLAIGGVQITFWMYIIQQINVIQSDQQATRENLSSLNGKLAPFDFATVK